MAWTNSPHIVSTAWLADHLTDPGVAVLDGSWHLPPENRDGAKEFLTAHIPGAQFFDINTVADTSTGLPHMLPPDKLFADTLRAMGIGDGMRVVVYDTKGLFSAPRVWWTFRVLGCRDVAVLDGGLPRWTAEGRAVEAGAAKQRPTQTFAVRRNAAMVRDIADMHKLLSSHTAQIVDARPSARFTGVQAEPRPGLTQGHMPGARNVPFTALVDAQGSLKSEAELRAVLAAAGVDAAKPVVASCGSGVTASMLALSLAVLGNLDVAVYDGAWAEWGANPANPIETGPAA